MINTSLNILITGGSSGIGRMAAKKLVELGHTVFITGRSQENLENAEEFITKDSLTGTLYKVEMVLDDFKSIQKCANTVKILVPHLNALVHNAAIRNNKLIQFCDNQVVGTVFANAIAPLYLNQLLLPLLQESSGTKRTVFMPSSLHNPDVVVNGEVRDDMSKDVQVPDDFEGLKNGETVYNASAFYTVSKLGCVWNAFSLAEKHPDITNIAICPGFVPSTNLARNEPEEFLSHLVNVVSKYGKVSTEEEAAAEYVHYVTAPEIDRLSGTFFSYGKVTESSKDSRNKEKMGKYWNYANKMIKLNLNQI